MTAIIALLAIVGYAYSSLSLAGIERFIPMALNTALALAVISSGILAARPDRGVMVVITSGDAGGVMARRLLPAVILIPALVGWLVWLGRHEGMLDRVMALSLFVLTNIVILTALIWWNAALLNRMDGGRRRAEEALRQGEERFRSLIEATTAIVWNTPASGEFETEQPGWSAFTGQTFDQLKGWGWLDAVHPDDRPNTARVWSAAVDARVALPGRTPAAPPRRRVSVHACPGRPHPGQGGRDPGVGRRAHRHRCRKAGRGRDARGQGGRRGRHPRQERVPGQHEP